MAYSNAERGGLGRAILDRIAGYGETVRKNYRAAARRRAAFDQTYRELSALSDRELADFGFAREEIGRIAREAARDV